MNNTFQVVKGQLWVHFNGRTFIFDDGKKQHGKRRKSKEGSGDIISPMPGKVTKIFHMIGDCIMQGDTILVMEAMKMEYTLKADAAGKIERVDCKVGDQVTLGKLLVKIEVEKKS